MHQVLGALRPTVGNTVGLTTRFSGSYPITIDRGIKADLDASAEVVDCHVQASAS